MSSSTSSHPTLLLKTRSTPRDTYTSLPSPTFLPVLTHTLVSTAQSTLISLLTSPVSSHTSFPSSYGGLIITSQRAVGALSAALETVSQRQDSEEIKARLKSWKLLIYVVGPATGKAVRELLEPWIPAVRIEGEESGNGEALAGHIVEAYQGGTRMEYVEAGTEARPPLLFLVGEQRRDIIPKTLASPDLSAHDKIRVEELVVYETVERTSFAGEFAAELERTREERVRWVVVFSPTGCEAVLRVLNWVGEDGKYDKIKRDSETRGNVFVASIGPTTRAYLRDRFDFEVDICAEKPSADSVGEGIKNFMERRST